MSPHLAAATTWVGDYETVHAAVWPVSVKATVVDSARVLLCLNDRGEWARFS